MNPILSLLAYSAAGCLTASIGIAAIRLAQRKKVRALDLMPSPAVGLSILVASAFTLAIFARDEPPTFEAVLLAVYASTISAAVWAHLYFTGRQLRDWGETIALLHAELDLTKAVDEASKSCADIHEFRRVYWKALGENLEQWRKIRARGLRERGEVDG